LEKNQLSVSTYLKAITDEILVEYRLEGNMKVNNKFNKVATNSPKANTPKGGTPKGNTGPGQKNKIK
jgi:hypothetical protein